MTHAEPNQWEKIIFTLKIQSQSQGDTKTSKIGKLQLREALKH